VRIPCADTVATSRRRQSMSKWTVWVGGGEINSYYLTKEEALELAQAWKDNGYDEVVMEEVNA